MRLREGAAALAAKDQELHALSSKLCSTTEALAGKTTQVQRQVSEILALKKSTNKLLAEEKEMQQGFQSLRVEIAALQASAMAKAKAMMTRVQEEAFMRLKEGAAALAAKDQELQALSSKLRSTHEALAAQFSEIDRQAADITDLQQHLASTSKQLEIEQQTVNSRERESETLRQELNALEAKLTVVCSSSDSVVQQMVQEIEMLKTRLEDAAKDLEIEKLKTRLEDAAKDLDVVAVQAQSESEEKTRLCVQLGALKKVQDDSEKIKELLQQLWHKSDAVILILPCVLIVLSSHSLLFWCLL
jgi:chromosome segregation ATPase